jgi:hypothetical protein
MQDLGTLGRPDSPPLGNTIINEREILQGINYSMGCATQK